MKSITANASTGQVFEDNIEIEEDPNLILKENKIGARARVDRYLSQRLQEGFFWEGIPVQTRPKDMDNLFRLGELARRKVIEGETRSIFSFRDANNVMHDLTPKQMLSLIEAAQDRWYQYCNHAFSIKDKQEAATDSKKLKEINIEKGWPSRTTGKGTE